MAKITVLPAGIEIAYTPGQTLLKILRGAGFLTDAPCGGRGTCGKCRVKVINGVLPPISDTESALLSREEVSENIRLACLVYPDGDAIIELLKAERGHSVLAEGYLPEFSLNPVARRLELALSPRDEDYLLPLEKRVMARTGTSRISLSALKALPDTVKRPFIANCYGGELSEVEPAESDHDIYGLAVDIGTTTVVAALIDLRSGRELAVRAGLNAQREYGLDVLTRITYIMENEEYGLNALQSAIIKQLSRMIAELCAETDIAQSQIHDIAVAANNTMLHILLGVHPQAIGQAPFAPVFCGAKTLFAGEIGLAACPSARLYCLPSASAYVGADVVAGVYACGLRREPGNALLLDIGTNGEMALACGGKLLCCSCAAGPALEGMNIFCGMRAADGAVEDVAVTGGKVSLTVIGGGEAAGLCGSGILAAISELLRAGLITANGRIAKAAAFPEEDARRGLLTETDGKPAIRLSERVLVTQTDIRQVQLAKGAILSGITAMLGYAGISAEDLSRVYVAGQFGAHLPVSSLTGSGLLPKGLAGRVTYVGNSSKSGAYLALCSSTARDEIERIAKSMTYIELSTMPGYEALFARCLAFSAE